MRRKEGKGQDKVHSSTAIPRGHVSDYRERDDLHVIYKLRTWAPTDFDTARAAGRALINVPVHVFVHASDETMVAAGELSKIEVFVRRYSCPKSVYFLDVLVMVKAVRRRKCMYPLGRT